MLSKNQIKLIKSLSQKKYRKKHGLFVVEGKKGIMEFLNSGFELENLFAKANIFSDNMATIISENDLGKISNLVSPNEALAIFKIPKESNFDKSSGLILALDGIRDPGNLGTIIRLCDWFGIETLVCSEDTVDCYNPKVVQASMGSLARIKVSYLDLAEFLQQSKMLKYGAFLEGDNVYRKDLMDNAILIMGNEANGISEKIEELVSEKINIPQFGKNQNTESLNVATATSILLSEFKRRTTER
ncbi:RNA methyltransferase [Gramella sp. AN32]|uniref:TrmH family RNA methyltransferase n=1 Tax=Christiangramia antarctica TaxID=2058158 RepID=A0ABW5X6I3_9FLAO|nr:RNA methyltransferase [Gramella sp. AN32]MCM4154818.1 RNA methyltransferase [Gramella sp. AN32]